MSVPRFDCPTIAMRPTDPAFYANPYPFYDRLRALAPLVVWEDYGFPVTAHYGLVSSLLRDRRFGRAVTHVRSRAELGWPPIPDHVKPFYDFESRSLLECEPPVHTRLRGLVNRAFVSRAIERLRPRIAGLADGLVDGFIAGGTVDLLEHYATPIPVIVIAELLGLAASDAPLLLDWSHRMVGMYQFDRTRATEDAAVAATLAFSAYVRDVVARKRRSPSDDLIGQLIEARDREDRLDDDELVTTVILLMNAGHEATVHALANAIGILLGLRAGDPAGWPDLAARLAEPLLAAALAEETLRADPPLHLFTRYALEDLEIEGVQLRCGDTVGLLLAAANRDPDVFARPYDFVADRYLAARACPVPMSFGAGLHFCIGAPLARMELEIGLSVLFRRIPDLRLPGPPMVRNAYHFHGYERLDAVW